VIFALNAGSGKDKTGDEIPLSHSLTSPAGARIAGRMGEAQCLGGLQIDQKFELRGMLDEQLGEAWHL
jgi:hypothetical protein